MTDTEAIALYVAAGNPREDWAALDDRDRWPWRKMAVEMSGLDRSKLETLEDATLLRMHDDIHKIMEARAVDMKERMRRDSVSRLPAAQ
jgi:hypothetical protein